MSGCVNPYLSIVCGGTVMNKIFSPSSLDTYTLDLTNLNKYELYFNLCAYCRGAFNIMVNTSSYNSEVDKVFMSDPKTLQDYTSNLEEYKSLILNSLQLLESSGVDIKLYELKEKVEAIYNLHFKAPNKIKFLYKKLYYFNINLNYLGLDLMLKKVEA